MADPKQLSQEAHDRLQAELEDLTTRGRIDIARKIETARELGDLSRTATTTPQGGAGQDGGSNHAPRGHA